MNAFTSQYIVRPHMQASDYHRYLAGYIVYKVSQFGTSPASPVFNTKAGAQACAALLQSVEGCK